MEFCIDAVLFLLGKDPKNEVDQQRSIVVHCKAGKGRTGLMLCCYMIFAIKGMTAKGALEYYGTERTGDKENGVTIES